MVWLQNSTTHQPFDYSGRGAVNVTGLFDTNLNQVAYYLYDPYATPIFASGPLAGINRYGFSSKEFMGNPRLSYFGRRFYDPGLQRWLSQDPLGEAAGLNLYQFSVNDPANKLDPFGLCAWPDAPSCFDNCWSIAQRQSIRALGDAAGGHAIGLGVGTIMAGVGLAVGSRGAPAAGVVIGGAGTVIDLIELRRTINDLALIKKRIRGDFAKCLLNCRRQFPGSSGEASDYWSEHQIK